MYSHIAGLLAEEMGLGKTLETLAGFDEGTLSFALPILVYMEDHCKRNTLS